MEKLHLFETVPKSDSYTLGVPLPNATYIDVNRSNMLSCVTLLACWLRSWLTRLT